MPPIDPVRPLPRRYQLPKFSFRVDDLAHEGSHLFFDHVNGSPIDVLVESVNRVIDALYPPPPPPTSTPSSSSSSSPSSVRSPPRDFARDIPEIKHVTLVLESMEGGVAYTCGSSHLKEVHLSLSYLVQVYHRSVRPSPPSSSSSSSTALNCATPTVRPLSERLRREISGVLTHELVHAFQWNGHSTVPGGVIEGVADWVRAQDRELRPPHWKDGKPRDGDRWDVGYQTTGFFLAWLSGTLASPTLVPLLNSSLRTEEWDDGRLLKELLGGQDVEALWDVYKEGFNGRAETDDDDQKPPEPVPTHRVQGGYEPRYV
ncbi:hypothetical protein JCM10212_004289 [Sporobolomyces blumeae]